MMCVRWQFLLCCSVFVGLLVASGRGEAGGLQVAPTTLSLAASQNADGLWLSNTGDNVVHAQVRVYRWMQDDKGDQLTESRDLVISPPMVELPVGARQLVRVIRVGAPPSGVEAAYRLAINELPIEAQGKPGLQFVMHYSLPIFVRPVDAAATGAPKLQWQLLREGSRAILQVSNHGDSYAQLADLDYLNVSGRRVEITPGLLGYVLSGAVMRWTLSPRATAFADGGTLHALVNGEKITQSLSLVDRSH